MIHRDEIHGDVRYDALAVELLNTGALQRLGRVYQLGYGHLVYRGGTHTRLSHSMGAYDAAGRLVDALRRNYESNSPWPQGAAEPNEFLPRSRGPEEDSATLALDVDDHTDRALGARWTVLRHLVGWAALLHDVGHVPLGHTLEDEFDGIYKKHDDPLSPRLQYLWLGTSHGATPEIVAAFRRVELYPSAFAELGLTDWHDVWGAVLLICMFKEPIGEHGTFVGELEVAIKESGASDDSGGTAVASQLLELHARLTPWLFAPYMTDIVANTISADYLDYLRRDPHNLGLDVLKDDRVVTRFWVGRDHAQQLRMALSLVDRRGKPRLDTCTGVVELVRQRYRFAEVVYYHKTKVAASAMLAKAFHLVGAPAEVPQPRDIPRLSEIESEVGKLVNGYAETRRREELRRLKASCLPSALLDPEIGDESLPVFLLNHAWQRFERAVRAQDEAEAMRAMLAITLLAALVRRSLYKVCLMMDAILYPRLSRQSGTPDDAREQSLGRLIHSLRKDSRARENLEKTMVAATAGWPQNSLLLYVPQRKSQAKGIETGALADGRVVTLGSHPAVIREVTALNEHYAALWRLIVFVHPDYAGDVIGLSAAMDALVESQFQSDVADEAVLSALKEACWFSYLPRKDREAARRYQELIEIPDPSSVDWSLIHEFESLLTGHTTNEELAGGAALLASLTDSTDLQTAKRLAGRYAEPAALNREVDRVLASGLQVRSREGAGDAPEELLAHRAAIEQIAHELLA